MRIHHLMEHVDSRSKISKLLDLYRHERTEPELKSSVLSKLLSLGVDPKEIVSDSVSDMVIKAANRPIIETNVDFDSSFSKEETFGDIITRLSAFEPRPSKVYFLRPPRMEIFVPPPYGNLTKIDYMNKLTTAVPCRMIRGFYHEQDQGYWFLLTL